MNSRGRGETCGAVSGQAAPTAVTSNRAVCSMIQRSHQDDMFNLPTCEQNQGGILGMKH